MNENSKRKSRKSKLELRECSDDEDENIIALQAGIEKLVNLKKQLLNRSEDDVAEGTAPADPINFQVQVKVEKCVDDDDEQNVTVVADDSAAGRGGDGEVECEYSSTSVDKMFEHQFYLRILQPSTKGTLIRRVKEYVFTKSSLRKGLEAQAKLNTSAVDRYIQIKLNNVHCEILTPARSRHEELIQKCLQDWLSWYESWPEVRETPLLYKCYLCSKGWWRLHPFREHIKEHDEPRLEVRAEQSSHQFNVVASVDKSDLMKVVGVDGVCHRCDEPMKYHVRKNPSYRCAGCKLEVTSCSKLRSHQAVCVKYTELKFKKQIQSSRAVMVCYLCGTHCVTEQQLLEHLVSHHSPRSDEPTAIQYAQCKYCGMNFVSDTYHDCPKKCKYYKCSHCCKKFTSPALLDLHNAVSSRRTVKCDVCAHSMKECMMLEHMLSHTRNYGAVYWCRKCDYLFTKYQMLLNHMRFHNKYTQKRRFTYKMLLPTRCINGEFAASMRTIDMPQSSVMDFLLGEHLEFSKLKSYHPIDSSSSVGDIDKVPDIRIVNDGAKRATASAAAATSDDPDHLALQLDAEIQQDLEMEEAISKVFKSSNCYKKFMEKELAEPTEEYLYDDDLIILENQDDILIVIDSDTDDRNGDEDAADDDGRNKKGGANDKDSTEAVGPDHDRIDETNLDRNVVKEEYADTNFEGYEYLEDLESVTVDGEEYETNYGINVDIKYEPVSSYVEEVFEADAAADKSQSADGSTGGVKAADLNPDADINRVSAKKRAKPARANTDLKVKKAKVKQYVRVKAETGCSYGGGKASSGFNPEQGYSSISDGNNMGVKEEFEDQTEHLETEELDIDVGWVMHVQEETSDSVTIESEKQSIQDGGGKPQRRARAASKSNFLTCAKCAFTGKYRRYTEHVISACSTSAWSCTRCAKKYNGLILYVKHLKEEHGSSCPECREVIKVPSHLHRHISIHVRSLFLNDSRYLTDLSWAYECRKCGKVQSLDDLFTHWESHLSVVEEAAPDDKPDMNPLSPEMVRRVIERLFLKTKQNKGELVRCVVCPKRFDRKNDTKRHLIEHLLSKALCDKVTTNNCLRCQICSSDLHDVYTWKQHMRDHADLPEYQCKTCKKRFSDSSNLAKHKKVHNFYSYVCDLCGSKFQAEASIVKHLMLHEQPPVHCKVCKATFYSTSRLNVHMKQRHQLSTFPCMICKKRFNSLKDKWDHMWEEHKQRSVEADCPICAKSFRKRSDVKTHLKEDHGLHVLSEIYRNI